MSIQPEGRPAPLPAPRTRRPRTVAIALATCMALQMTSYVMILPLFARRFSEFGAGVEALGTSAMAYALAATITAPFMGALADRIGRRPLVLGSLAVYVFAFTGYLLAFSAPAFIVLRLLAGALTAGLIPAATGIVADVAPNDRRAQWIGILSGGASVGWIAGPVLGGLLYDRWGYSLALIVAIFMAAAALVAAWIIVPETHHPAVHRSPDTSVASGPRVTDIGPSLRRLRGTLPQPLPLFGMLLCIYFAVMFSWAFIEPRLTFYAYDDLGWSSSMLGFVMSTYGIALMVGEFGLSRLSDRLGRKPVIIAGLLLFSAQFIGLALSRDYFVIAIAFIIAGFGNSLFDPALSASILDITPPGHQARVLGIKSTVGSLGNILGPALVVAFTSLMAPGGIFLISAGVVFVITLAGLLARFRPVLQSPPLAVEAPTSEAG